MKPGRNREGKYSRASAPKKRGPSIAVTVFLDLLMVGLILVMFAFFHHVMPAIISERDRLQEAAAAAQSTEIATEPTQMPETQPLPTQTEEQTQPAETVLAETEPPATEAPDLRTPWQKKFAEHFSDEVVLTENSYKSPNVSITVETLSYGEGASKQTYHVADIYVASMDYFTTYTANNEIRYFGTQDVMKMVKASDAILAISGDFITYQKAGFLLRNGQVYAETTNNVSICALFPDGTIETYDKKGYDIEQIKSRNPLQVWSFGPVLLDENGKVREKYDMPQAVSYPNPRSAIGYYEPGHYCFVVVDGRQSDYAKGMTISELAQVFEDLGCIAAYNLDGGGSAVMVFNQERYSKQSNGGDRKLGDILLIRDFLVPADEEISE